MLRNTFVLGEFLTSLSKWLTSSLSLYLVTEVLGPQSLDASCLDLYRKSLLAPYICKVVTIILQMR